jgi:hypothetical protein
MVVHACNPSTQKAEAKEFKSSKAAYTMQQDPISKKKKKIKKEKKELATAGHAYSLKLFGRQKSGG